MTNAPMLCSGLRPSRSTMMMATTMKIRLTVPTMDAAARLRSSQMPSHGGGDQPRHLRRDGPQIQIRLVKPARDKKIRAKSVATISAQRLHAKSAMTLPVVANVSRLNPSLKCILRAEDRPTV